MENLFKKVFSKPFPKFFGSPSLRDGLGCFAMIHAEFFINSLFRFDLLVFVQPASFQFREHALHDTVDVAGRRGGRFDRTA